MTAPNSTPTEREAGDVGCTCANDGNASRCPLHTQADYDASARAGDVGEVAAVLAAHGPDVTSYDAADIHGCDCGWGLTGEQKRGDDYGWGAYWAHVAAALAPLIAERERAARAEAEADRDHWKAHAEEAGEGFSRVCKDYARVAARNSELIRRVEAVCARMDADDSGLEGWAEDVRAALAPEGTQEGER